MRGVVRSILNLSNLESERRMRRSDSWTLFSLTIGGVLLSFGIVAPMKSTVVSKLEPIVLYGGLMVSI